MDTGFPPSDGDRDRRVAILGVIIGTVTPAIILVVLRMMTRKFLSKNLGWDDWTILIAMFGTTIGAIFGFIEIHYGYGRHRFYLSQHEFQEFKKYTYFDWVQTFTTLTATKVSICLLLLRIVVDKRILKPIQGLIGVLLVSYVILLLLYIFQCIPLDAAWDLTKQGKCLSDGQVERVVLSQAIISIISDFLCATFPILILRKVRIDLRTKVTCCVLMGLGLITAGCCIVRTISNWQNEAIDTSWVSINTFIWRTVEVNVGIMAASIPTLPPLYRLLRDRMPNSKKSSTSSPSSNAWLRRHHESNGIIQAPKSAHTRDTGDSFILPLHTFDMEDENEKRTMSDGTRETTVASLEVDRDLERMESKESRMGSRMENRERLQHVEYALGYAI